MSDDIVPLSSLSRGERGTVVALKGGSVFQDRVVSMGLFAGCAVRVIGGGAGGHMLLGIGDTRIALGHGMADKVMVTMFDD